jgi:quercetin dioxygenase-like cupin family protein
MKVKSCFDVSAEEIKMEGVKDGTVRWLISESDGAPNFAMRHFEFKPGGHSPLHTHPYEHEVYVLEGTGAFVCEGKEYAFKKDYCIFVPPDKLHQFRNTGDVPVRFLCMVPDPGKT